MFITDKASKGQDDTMLSDLFIALLYSIKRITDLLVLIIAVAELCVFLLKINVIEQNSTFATNVSGQWPKERYRDKPTLMAQSAIDFIAKLFGQNLFSRHTIFKFFMISCAVSSLALIVGGYIDLYFQGATSFDEVLTDLVPVQGFYRSELLFPFNAFLDYVALHITIGCLRGIIREKGLFLRVSIVLFDLFCGLLLAFASTVGIRVLASSQLYPAREITTGIIYETMEVYRSFLAQPIWHWFDGTHNFDAFLFGVTALFPTALYLGWLLVIIFKQSAVNAYQRHDFSKTIQFTMMLFFIVVTVNLIAEKIIDLIE